MLSQGAFKGLKKKIDYAEYGGAPLLGVRGVCVIGHGRSNVRSRSEKCDSRCRWVGALSYERKD